MCVDSYNTYTWHGAITHWTNVEAVEAALPGLTGPGIRLWSWDRQLRFNADFYDQQGVTVTAEVPKGGSIHTCSHSIHNQDAGQTILALD